VALVVDEADALIAQAEIIIHQLYFLQGQLSVSGQGSGSATIQQEVDQLVGVANSLLADAETLDHQAQFLQGELSAPDAGSGSGAGTGSGSGSGSTTIAEQVTALADQAHLLTSRALTLDQGLSFVEGEINGLG